MPIKKKPILQIQFHSEVLGNKALTHKFCVLFKILVYLLIFDHGSQHVVEKAMAPHSSTLAWKIPWTEEPGGLQSMGLLRVGHD